MIFVSLSGKKSTLQNVILHWNSGEIEKWFILFLKAFVRNRMSGQKETKVKLLTEIGTKNIMKPKL